MFNVLNVLELDLCFIKTSHDVLLTLLVCLLNVFVVEMFILFIQCLG